MEEALIIYLKDKAKRKSNLKTKGVRFLDEGEEKVQESKFIKSTPKLKELLSKRGYSNIQYLGSGFQSNVVRCTKHD